MRYGLVHFFFALSDLSDLTLLESSSVVQAEDDTLPLSIRRTRRANRRLPKRFRDMLPEAPLPLLPQDVDAAFGVGPPQANSNPRPSATATSPSTNHSSSQADPTAQSARLPSKPRAVLITERNSFGLFRVYDEASIPSINDPEDQSGADPLPTKTHGVSQSLPSSINPFHPYPNESSWCLGDWYWNQGAQKSKDSFKQLVQIITSPDFRSEDLCHTNWTAIDRQLGSLYTVQGPSQASTMATDSEEFQTEDGGWIRKDITISVPFPRRSLHPGPKDYTISDFYCRPLLSIIREALSDPVRCKNFRFEPYSLRWKRSCEDGDIGVYGELFSSQAFISAHRDLQAVSTTCPLPRRIVGLMFWSDATQLTAFGDAKLWPLYVYFGNESKYQRCTPTANLCAHAAYFQTVCVPYFVAIHIYCFQSSYLMVSTIS